MDFDDLIMTVEIFDRFPTCSLIIRISSRHVLIDEFQDTNPAQAGSALCWPESSATSSSWATPIKGSTDFAAPTIKNLLDFERDWPDARSITLEQNYRSTQTILNAANSVIENNVMRKPK